MLSYLSTNPLLFFIYLFSLFITITIHEFAHAYTADQLGDPTPRLQNRLNINPINHLDIYGLMFLLFFGFGWGKPVEIDIYNLKNPRKDSALISLAGPISNFIIALIISILLRLFNFFELNILTTIGTFLFIPLIQINIILGFFNLIPIHPLDGFKIIGGFLPEEKAKEWYQLQKYGFLFLFLLIFPFFGQSFLDSFFKPIVSFLFSIFIP